MRKGLVALSLMTLSVGAAAGFATATYAGFVTNTRIEGATVGVSRVIYLDTGDAESSDWNKDGARFFAYVWLHDTSGEDSDGAFVDNAFMKNIGEGNRYFWAVIPTTCNRILFGRMNPAAPAPDFSPFLWNKTVDLTLQSDKDLFVVGNQKDSEGSYLGSWSMFVE